MVICAYYILIFVNLFDFSHLLRLVVIVIRFPSTFLWARECPVSLPVASDKVAALFLILDSCSSICAVRKELFSSK